MDWVAAFALLLLLEGMLPFAMPQVWKAAFTRMTAMPDHQLRLMGLLSMAAGLALLLWMR